MGGRFLEYEADVADFLPKSHKISTSKPFEYPQISVPMGTKKTIYNPFAIHHI